MAVFPTHVGVFLKKYVCPICEEGLPHARGGVSEPDGLAFAGCESSPRTWGCFQYALANIASRLVFPTHVGVFLPSAPLAACPSCLPHARGGVSNIRVTFLDIGESSPRTWGCFRRISILILWHGVFPTHVGVFLDIPAVFAYSLGLPHARGGVSEVPYVLISGLESSPRTWGCFLFQVCTGSCLCVFPTHVGVFLYDFPIY